MCLGRALSFAQLGPEPGLRHASSTVAVGCPGGDGLGHGPVRPHASSQLCPHACTHPKQGAHLVHRHELRRQPSRGVAATAGGEYRLTPSAIPEERPGLAPDALVERVCVSDLGGNRLATACAHRAQREVTLCPQCTTLDRHDSPRCPRKRLTMTRRRAASWRPPGATGVARPQVATSATGRGPSVSSASRREFSLPESAPGTRGQRRRPCTNRAAGLKTGSSMTVWEKR